MSRPKRRVTYELSVTGYCWCGRRRGWVRNEDVDWTANASTFAGPRTMRRALQMLDAAPEPLPERWGTGTRCEIRLTRFFRRRGHQWSRSWVYKPVGGSE